MNFYSNNYCNIKGNYVICNIRSNSITNKYIPTIKVLKNILTRGTIVNPSIYLKEKYLYNNKLDNKSDYLISFENNTWFNTIKGDDNNLYNPALDFYNNIDKQFPEYKFIKNLILPEVKITDIIGECDELKNQSVDFYLPQANIVIEIDGYQHNFSVNQDKKRDRALSKDNTVFRFTTKEIKRKRY